MSIKSGILWGLLFSFSSLLGQEVTELSKPKKSTNKGKFFVYWGWNWASYTDSDIRFKGPDYDYSLKRESSRPANKIFCE